MEGFLMLRPRGVFSLRSLVSPLTYLAHSSQAPSRICCSPPPCQHSPNSRQSPPLSTCACKARLAMIKKVILKSHKETQAKTLKKLIWVDVLKINIRSFFTGLICIDSDLRTKIYVQDDSIASSYLKFSFQKPTRVFCLLWHFFSPQQEFVLSCVLFLFREHPYISSYLLPGQTK